MPWPVSSSPSASSAAMIRARENCFSDTREDLPCDEDAVTGEDGRRVRKRVGVKRRTARDEPPGLDEALLALDPVGHLDIAFGSEELGDPGQGSVETPIPGRRRL